MMDPKTPHEMTDLDLDKLLAAATAINVPAGAEARLMQGLPAREERSNPFSMWKLALPLAASLLLGVYLGAGGYGTNYFPDSVNLSTEDDTYDFTTGAEEAVDTAESDLS